MWGYNLKILFWNTHSNNVNEYIVNLVIDNGIDVLVMAEYEDNEDELKMLFDKAGISLTLQNTIGCTRKLLFNASYKKSIYYLLCSFVFQHVWGWGR